MASDDRPDPTDIGGRPLPATRLEARERALHLLYEADLRSEDPAAVLAAQVVPPDAYTVVLVQGVGDHLEEVDDIIGRRSVGWTVARMPVMDRAVLRMAAFELLHRDDVPTAVVINEAVELAKRYSTDESGRFVNGVLSAVAGETR